MPVGGCAVTVLTEALQLALPPFDFAQAVSHALVASIFHRCLPSAAVLMRYTNPGADAIEALCRSDFVAGMRLVFESGKAKGNVDAGKSMLSACHFAAPECLALLLRASTHLGAILPVESMSRAVTRAHSYASAERYAAMMEVLKCYGPGIDRPPSPRTEGAASPLPDDDLVSDSGKSGDDLDTRQPTMPVSEEATES